MSNGYKQALKDFEQAVRAHENEITNFGGKDSQNMKIAQANYQWAKKVLILKLQYRDK